MKFGYSEKATKFEKKNPIRILWPPQNIRTLIKHQPANTQNCRLSHQGNTLILRHLNMMIKWAQFLLTRFKKYQNLILKYIYHILLKL